MSWFVALLVLSALIFFHELGHYAAARLMGVYVEVFSIGFGSKVASFKRWGTEWRIALIPLGGYVKMKGQDDSDPSKKSYDTDSYNVKTPMQKIFILLAGPLANFVLAFFLYFVIALGGPQVASPVIGEVLADSPAQKAGLLKNDTILQINDQAIKTWKEMAEIISSAEGTLSLQVDREGYIEVSHAHTPAQRDNQSLR
jgi:regulator of sigma E protease